MHYNGETILSKQNYRMKCIGSLWHVLEYKSLYLLPILRNDSLRAYTLDTDSAEILSSSSCITLIFAFKNRVTASKQQKYFYLVV
jgi:hypothetical protein